MKPNAMAKDFYFQKLNVQFRILYFTHSKKNMFPLAPYFISKRYCHHHWLPDDEFSERCGKKKKVLMVFMDSP